MSKAETPETTSDVAAGIFRKEFGTIKIVAVSLVRVPTIVISFKEIFVYFG